MNLADSLRLLADRLDADGPAPAVLKVSLDVHLEEPEQADRFAELAQISQKDNVSRIRWIKGNVGSLEVAVFAGDGPREGWVS